MDLNLSLYITGRFKVDDIRGRLRQLPDEYRALSNGVMEPTRKFSEEERNRIVGGSAIYRSSFKDTSLDQALRSFVDRFGTAAEMAEFVHDTWNIGMDLCPDHGVSISLLAGVHLYESSSALLTMSAEVVDILSKLSVEFRPDFFRRSHLPKCELPGNVVKEKVKSELVLQLTGLPFESDSASLTEDIPMKLLSIRQVWDEECRVVHRVVHRAVPGFEVDGVAHGCFKVADAIECFMRKYGLALLEARKIRTLGLAHWKIEVAMVWGDDGATVFDYRLPAKTIEVLAKSELGIHFVLRNFDI